MSPAGPGGFSTITHPRWRSTTRSASGRAWAASTAKWRGSRPHLGVLVRRELDRRAAGHQAALAAVGRRLAEIAQRGQPVVEPAPPHLPLSDKFEGAVGR